MVKEHLHILIAMCLLAGWIVAIAEETHQTNMIPSAPTTSQQ